MRQFVTEHGAGQNTNLKDSSSTKWKSKNTAEKKQKEATKILYESSKKRNGSSAGMHFPNGTSNKVKKAAQADQFKRVGLNGHSFCICLISWHLKGFFYISMVFLAFKGFPLHQKGFPCI